jgi:signal transduction histidine kinase
LDLITDLLDVNSLVVNREPSYSAIELNKVVLDRVGVFAQAAMAKEIGLITDCEYLEVITDVDYLGRILDNLLSNAIKFSPSKSSIHIYGGQQNNKVVLSIRDQGPGFSESDKKFLFQKFKKLSARPTAGESSNGLGLAIVKILVDRLAGKIQLKSDPGKGSEFIVRLPVKK